MSLPTLSNLVAGCGFSADVAAALPLVSGDDIADAGVWHHGVLNTSTLTSAGIASIKAALNVAVPGIAWDVGDDSALMLLASMVNSQYQRAVDARVSNIMKATSHGSLPLAADEKDEDKKNAHTADFCWRAFGALYGDDEIPKVSERIKDSDVTKWHNQLLSTGCFKHTVKVSKVVTETAHRMRSERTTTLAGGLGPTSRARRWQR